MHIPYKIRRLIRYKNYHFSIRCAVSDYLNEAFRWEAQSGHSGFDWRNPAYEYQQQNDVYPPALTPWMHVYVGVIAAPFDIAIRLYRNGLKTAGIEACHYQDGKLPGGGFGI